MNYLNVDKLLIESTKSSDYDILKKGAEKADGINDVEEFRVTEVRKWIRYFINDINKSKAV